MLEARYEEGLLRPTSPLALKPGERVRLILVRHPEPSRWDLERLAGSSSAEDDALAETGLAEWADELDSEDATTIHRGRRTPNTVAAKISTAITAIPCGVARAACQSAIFLLR